jgi:Flp pilus assembly CpaF family ATPase
MPNAKESSKNSATLPNLTANSLRATPEIIILGEARHADEFEEMMRNMKTGHVVLGTFHSDDSVEGAERIADEIGGDYEASLRKVCKSLDIIIAPFKFENGERKIMEITEIQGVDREGNPKVNKLFTFEMTGEEKFDENGNLIVDGSFEQTGYLSKKTQSALLKAMIPKKEFAEFCESEDNKEVR